VTDFVYEASVALDPSQGGVLVRSATGSIYAISDTTFSTPLTARGAAGDVKTTIVSSSQGVIESFIVEDQPEVIWVSGPYAITLSSITGIKAAADASAAASAASAIAANQAAERAVQYLTLDGAPASSVRIWAPSTQEPLEEDGALDGDQWMRLP
jgi:hypothetical protein